MLHYKVEHYKPTRAVRIAASFSNQMRDVKALIITGADGKTLNVETDKRDPEVGNPVKIDNKPAPDGEYIIPAIEKVLTVSRGIIKEIKDHIPDEIIASVNRFADYKDKLNSKNQKTKS